MKPYCYLFALVAAPSVFGFGTLIQTFESGEDTSDWGNSFWDAPAGFTATTPSFLDSSIGGAQAGYGSTSDGQDARRVYKFNTANLDYTSEYTISLYIVLSSDSIPSSGEFSVINGNYGGESFGDLRVVSDGDNLDWEARDDSVFQDVGIDLAADTPYFIQFTIKPETATYDVYVAEVDTFGVVQESGSLTDLSIASYVITNDNYSTLRVHANASAGTLDFAADNINIANVPEPRAFAALAGCVALAAVWRRRQQS
ncbi:hypothetical protein [Cerasicoccus frondis]|uniref:hypothetical protein n=1 Tax=Cerasicoccus frondis TaxID=490090 RepID=UPI0028528EB9|nr:hypothetical protein [Cerasicoccus frondis]